MATKGTVLKIDRGSTHDGPGTRTVIFLKGCPLRCLWCSTPDSQESKPQMLHFEKFCQKCGKCIAACPNSALSASNSELRIDRAKCDSCGVCQRICPNNAMRISGTEMTVAEVMEIIERQSHFWRRMGGGVTISGGEVFAQHEFAREILECCHDQGIDTNIETSCNAASAVFGRLLPFLDHICCDVKHMNNAEHQRLTGVPNKIIMDNIRHASEHLDLILRFPVIPEHNDSDENIDDLIEFIKSLGKSFNRLDLLSYHQMGAITYKRLGRKYELEHLRPHTQERMKAICDKIRSSGINACLA